MVAPVVVCRHTHSVFLGRPSDDTVQAQASRHSPNAEARDLYLKGRYFWNRRTPGDLNKAIDSFTQAIVKDPSDAPAYVGLADCYNLLREFGAMSPSKAYPRALSAAQRAVELDDSSAEAHNSLAFVTFWWLWHGKTAEREFQRAIELNPNLARAHHWYATYLPALHRHREALDQIEQAQRLEPSSTAVLADKRLSLVESRAPRRRLGLAEAVGNYRVLRYPQPTTIWERFSGRSKSIPTRCWKGGVQPNFAMTRPA